METRQDSPNYLKKKALFNQLLTVYGRKPVLEALQDNTLPCFRLHLAESNKASPIIRELEQLAQQRTVDILYHDRQALSRISKNGKQDQGVCLDIHCPSHQHYQSFLDNQQTAKPVRLLALDRITNPQNLGMIIRSACAGNIDGILISERGCAKLDALVIKASAGTLFRTPILRCDDLDEALNNCQKTGMIVVGLSGRGTIALANYQESAATIYVLGNETEGMSASITQRCDHLVHIPMNNKVESLNVAVTASLLAFRQLI